jgi:hypothetical protein
MELCFSKMHGLGNDFVVINAIDQDVRLSTQQIRHIADRRHGVGCDQVLLVESPAQDDVEFRYRIFTYDVLRGVTDPDQIYDSFNIGIGPPGVVQPTHVFTDGNRTTSYGQLMDLGWRDGSVDLRPYAGQVVKACLANVTRVDEAYNTWTIVDDVRMVNLEHRLYVPIIKRASPTSGLSQKVHPKPVRSQSGAER